jgi:hypothetical protein
MVVMGTITGGVIAVTFVHLVVSRIMLFHLVALSSLEAVWD